MDKQTHSPSQSWRVPAIKTSFIDPFGLVHSVCLHHVWSIYLFRNITIISCAMIFPVCFITPLVQGITEPTRVNPWHIIPCGHLGIDLMFLPLRLVLASSTPCHTLLATSSCSQLSVMPPTWALRILPASPPCPQSPSLTAFPSAARPPH